MTPLMFLVNDIDHVYRLHYRFENTVYSGFVVKLDLRPFFLTEETIKHTGASFFSGKIWQILLVVVLQL